MKQTNRAIARRDEERLPAKNPRKRKKRKPQQKSHTRAILITCVLIALVAVGGVFGMYRAETLRLEKEAIERARLEEEARLQKLAEDTARYRHIMDFDVFVDGISVNDIPIGGMTLQEAIKYLRERLDIQPMSGTVTVMHEGTPYLYDLSGVIIQDDLGSVLQQALADVRTENMEQTLAKADYIAEHGKNYTVTFSKNTDSVGEFIESVAQKIDKPVQNAGIGNVDTENHTVELVPAKSGLSVNKSDLQMKILDAIENGNAGPINIPTTVLEPSVDDESVRMIEINAVTSFKGSNSNRIYNIKKGAKLMNGKVLRPGETFSCNEILGVRTLKNGWKEANAYVSGTTEVQAGGGVCQLSSTLYNAVVKADLKVVKRQNHSMPVSYMDKGLDATINSVGNIIDFQFRNNTGSDLVVFAWTVEKKLYFRIVRVAFPTDEFDEIRLSSKKLKTIEPSGEMSVTVDKSLAPGEEVVDVARQNGSLYQSYKEFYKNGELVRKEKLDQSTYKSFNGAMRVGPAGSSSSNNEVPVVIG
ncbi:MAG: VanW family protein [Clostridia bacterium]|nr:VanW family protein [Clostridia bacterium]